MSEFIGLLASGALSEIQQANKEVTTLVANIDKINQKIKSVSTPSGANNAIKDLSAEYQRQEKVIQSLQQKLQRASEQAVKNAERQRLAEIKLATDREKAFDKYDKALAREQAKLSASENLYSKVQAKMNALSNEYKILATRKELGLTLTAKEEQRYTSLQTRIQKYDTTLKAVDASMGKYSRNVGNYAGSFNPLNNSIAQLGREMPAFANSVQTGFMAISNNLPIFFDAMQNVIAQNKELQAQGQPTKSVLSQLAGALFSFQTLLSVGVTLLTVYGKEIVNWVSSLWGASEALDELNKNQEKFNNAKKDGRKESVAERVEVEKYVRVMRNRNLTDNERNIALEKLRSQFPAYFKDLSNEQMLNGNIRKNLAELNLALERRASLTRATEANVLNKQRLLDLQEELRLNKLLIISRKAEKEEAIKAQEETSGNYRQQELRANRAVTAINNLIKAEKENERIQKDIVAFQKAIANNDKTINELKGQTILLEETLNDTKDKGNKIKKESLDLQERELGVEANSRVAFERNISAIQGQLDKMSILNPQYKLLEFNLRLVKDAYEALYGEQKKQESVNDPLFGTLDYYEKLKSSLQQQQKALADSNDDWNAYQKLIEAVQIDIDILTGKQEKLNKSFFDAQGYFKGFVDSFSAESGFSEVFKVFDLMNQEFETAEDKARVIGLAISEAFQQAFNTIAQSSNANFQQMYSNLEQQRDVAILFAGESATAREEIERQYEERRRRIQRQQAEAQKRLALFNIATNTAQAIIATLAQTPPPAGIPLAVLVGAIGAAQLALTASQPIPAFEKGGIHDGGLMLVNDGKGANYRETIVTPDGKVMKPQGKNVVMNAPKGTQIFTHDQWQDRLNNLLLSNGIEQSNSRTEVNPIINVETKDNYHFEVNEKGFKTFVTRGQAKTEILNARFRQQKRYV